MCWGFSVASLILNELPLGLFYSSAGYTDSSSNHWRLQRGLPLLRLQRCSLSDAEGFKSGKLPMCAPSKEYMNTLVRGLVEGKHLTKAEAINYIHDAAVKKL